MSTTKLVFYKKHLQHKVSEADIKHIVEKYSRYNKAHDVVGFVTEEDAAKNIPLIVECDEATSSDSRELALYDQCVDLRDHCRCVETIHVGFGDALNCLARHFGLNSFRLDSSMAEITIDTAKKISQAIHYLLDESYSAKVECILDNDLIKLLGERYLPYMEAQTPSIHVSSTDEYMHYRMNLLQFVASIDMFIAVSSERSAVISHMLMMETAE